MVRLEFIVFHDEVQTLDGFQFLNGAIGVAVSMLFFEFLIRFQFLNGAIGVFIDLAESNELSKFQFLNGAIGVEIESQRKPCFAGFNS